MYYLFRIENPIFLSDDSNEARSFIFAFSAKNKESLLKKIRKNNLFMRKLEAIANLKEFFLMNSIIVEFDSSSGECLPFLVLKEEGKLMKFSMNNIFEELHNYYGDKLSDKIRIRHETESKEKLIDHISFLNNFSYDLHSIQWIELPLYNMLQFSNQKEINPVIHDFVNHPLFDRNVLRLINDY